MYKQNVLDQEAFARESTIQSAVSNPYLLNGKVLIAETGIFYNIVDTTQTGAIELTNGKFLVHQENIKINGNVLKGEVSVKANQIPQDANNRFVTDTEKTNWNNKSNKTVQIIAGSGLTGGGNLEANRTISVATANDGIEINISSIRLNTVNDLSSSSTTRPLSAAQGKALEDKKVNRSGDTLTGILKSNSDIRTTGKIGIGLSVETTPTLNVTIGDSDTGFKWVSDGIIEGWANNVANYRWNATDFYMYKKLTVTGTTALNSTLNVSGDTNIGGEIKTNKAITIGNNKAKIEYNADTECIEFKFL